MNDTNKTINIAVVFPERRPQTDPNFEIEIEKWEEIRRRNESLEIEETRVTILKQKQQFRLNIIGIIGAVLMIIGFIVVFRSH